MKTSHLDMKLIYSHQAQKEIIINEALVKIDSLLNSGAISMNMNEPPTTADDGDVYIVGSSPAGKWKDHKNHIAYYYSQHWYFIAPKTGSIIWVNDIKNIFYYDQETWNPYKP